MTYAERKTIETACYDAWKQAEQSSTTASDALNAAIDAKFSARRNIGAAWTQADQKQLDERREYAAAAEKKENAARLAYYISADNARRETNRARADIDLYSARESLAGWNKGRKPQNYKLCRPRPAERRQQPTQATAGQGGPHRKLRR